MIIVYESKTGFTRKYAEMLAKASGLRAIPAAEASETDLSGGVVFLGWMKVGKIQGLRKIPRDALRAVCGSGTGRAAEPDAETVMARNGIQGLPFFYLRGGCKPLKELKGMDRLLLSFFVSMLKKREQNEETAEAVSFIENGYDGVREENLAEVLAWLRENAGAAAE